MVDVIIPVYRPDETLRLLLQKLQEQTFAIHKVIIANTEQQLWENYVKQQEMAGFLASLSMELEVFHVSKKDFDHGGTRRLAVARSGAPYFICMTQDAVPVDQSLVERLLEPLLAEAAASTQGQLPVEDRQAEPLLTKAKESAQERTAEDGREQNPVAAVCARQAARPDCSVLEAYTRSFNYPKEDCVKSGEDLKRLGIKTFFCSNVCAAYRRDIYEELGGFEEHTIFNEDMIYAGHAVMAGYSIAYAAGAVVQHSHNYTGKQQYRRNFDLAVSQKQHPEVFAGVRSESEGIRMVKKTARYLLTIKKPWLIFHLLWQSGWKYLGYRAGKRYESMGKSQILKRTMNPGYWQALWEREAAEPRCGSDKK